MRQISIAVLVLALFSLAPAAGAQTTVPFMTVDDVSVKISSIIVTGVLQGDTRHLHDRARRAVAAGAKPRAPRDG